MLELIRWPNERGSFWIVRNTPGRGYFPLEEITRHGRESVADWKARAEARLAEVQKESD